MNSRCIGTLILLSWIGALTVRAEEVASLPLAVTVLEQALHQFPAANSASAENSIMRHALQSIRNGRAEDGRQELKSLQRSLQGESSRSDSTSGNGGATRLDSATRELLLEQFAERNPEALRNQVDAFVAGLQAQLEATRSLELELRHHNLVSGSLSPVRNWVLGRTFESATESLDLLRRGLQGRPIIHSIHFVRHSAEFVRRYSAFLAAYVERFETVSEHAEHLDRAITDFFITGGFRIESWDSETVAREETEAKLRIYLNRETVGAVTLCVSLAVEIGGLAFTGGATAETIPGTVAALYRAVQVTNYGISVASGAFWIAERVQQDGVRGFYEFDTLLNLVGMAKLLPIPYQRILGSRAVEVLSGHRRAFDIAWAGRRCLYSIYQLTQVDQLSRRWQLAPSTVRRNAVISLLTGLFSGGKRVFYPELPRSAL